ncbi:MAG: glutamyl-tRNA reductase [Pirellulales bacterium]
MKVRMVGCSHHNASLELRERLAFNPAQTKAALQRFRLVFPRTEAVLLSTCNRVEVYTAIESPDEGPSHEQVAEFLAGFHGMSLYDIFDDLFERTGDDAVRHLFSVAASLDSMVLGEPHILAQVKQAYQLATQENSAGPLTHAIFQAAVKVARRVTNETSLHQKRVSIPSVAVAEFASQVFERFDDKQVLVIGAGEMAEETLRYLREAGAHHPTIVNRSYERARELAQQWEGRVAPWDALLGELVRADLVVSTTGAAAPVVTLAGYRQIEAQRYQRPLFVLDLAIPRDFEPAIGECLQVFLYSLDDLKAACELNRRERDAEMPRAVAIIEDETARFMADLHHRSTGPIIQQLKLGWQTPKEEELRRLFNKLPQLDERARAEVEQSFDRLLNKLLHPPLETLRDESRHGIPHALLDAFKRLFQLMD